MTLGGCRSVEFNIVSPPEKFCQGYMEIAKPPNDKVWVKELEALPSGERRTQLTMEGFQISEWVRTLAKPCPIYGNSEEGKARNVDNTKLEGTMSVIHTEGNDGGHATWTVQFEKVSDDMKDPESIINTTKWYFKRMDQEIFSNL